MNKSDYQSGLEIWTNAKIETICLLNEEAFYEHQIILPMTKHPRSLSTLPRFPRKPQLSTNYQTPFAVVQTTPAILNHLPPPPTTLNSFFPISQKLIRPPNHGELQFVFVSLKAHSTSFQIKLGYIQLRRILEYIRSVLIDSITARLKSTQLVKRGLIKIRYSTFEINFGICSIRLLVLIENYHSSFGMTRLIVRLVYHSYSEFATARPKSAL